MLKKIDFYVEPRQSGKTSKIIKEVNNYGNANVLIITLNQSTKLEIDKNVSVPVVSHTAVVSHNVIDNIFFMRNNRFDKIWIDEYLFFYPEVIKYLNENLLDFTNDVCIRTTPYKMIHRKIYDFVKSFRKIGISTNISFDSPVYFQEFEYLYENLLTHPKTNLIYSYGRKKESFLHDKEKFEIECLGKLIIED